MITNRPLDCKWDYGAWGRIATPAIATTPRAGFHLFRWTGAVPTERGRLAPLLRGGNGAGVRLKARNRRNCVQEAGIFEGYFALDLVQNARTARVSALKIGVAGRRRREKIF